MDHNLEHFLLHASREFGKESGRALAKGAPLVSALGAGAAATIGGPVVAATAAAALPFVAGAAVIGAIGYGIYKAAKNEL